MVCIVVDGGYAAQADNPAYCLSQGSGCQVSLNWQYVLCVKKQRVSIWDG